MAFRIRPVFEMVSGLHLIYIFSFNIVRHDVSKQVFDIILVCICLLLCIILNLPITFKYLRRAAACMEGKSKTYILL